MTEASSESLEIILELPVELREHIFDYCSMDDLQNLSCANKRYYHCVRHLLWREIEIPWKSIQKESVLPKNMERLKLTQHINFSDADDGNGFVTTPSKWVHVQSGFKKILRTCNRNKLTSLKICGLAADNGVKTACTMLTNLTELWLSGCQYPTIIAWKTLSTTESLRKLIVEDCRIFNAGISALCDSQFLTELGIHRCQLITDPCMESIGKMRQLKKLSIRNNRNITIKGMRCLARLRNLNRLQLEYNDVDTDGNPCLSQLTFSLDRVDRMGAHRLNVTGFYEFSTPPVVEGDNGTEGDGLSEDKLPHVALEHYRKMKEVEEDMKSDEVKMTVDKDNENGKCSVNWKSTSLL